MKKIDLLLGISNIILDIHDQRKALAKIASYIKESIECDVCSIYLLDRDKKKLTLSATEGLSQNAVNSVVLDIDDGLTGHTYAKDEYTFIRNATGHDKYHYFPGINEEPYNTFIGIPLSARAHNFGVIVFQFKANKRNTGSLQKILMAVAAQVSGLILKHYLFRDESVYLHEFSNGETVVTGVPLSQGIAIGNPVMVISKFYEKSDKDLDTENELAELDKAFIDTKEDLQELIKELEESDQPFGEIFETHLMMLQDGIFRSDIERHIKDLKKSAAFSVRHVADKLIKKFSSIKDVYIRERASDIDDIANRILSHLGVMSRNVELKENSVLIADRLTPGETASINLDKVCGFVTEKDGVTSHTAILAKSRQLPAISGVKRLYQAMEYAEKIIVDGFEGKVIFNPTEETIQKYAEEMEKNAPEELDTENLANPEVFLNDGSKVNFYANNSSILDAEKSSILKAHGIGLVRTEIFYLQRDGHFKQEEQVEVYTQILSKFPDSPVIFRLLDIGSDKKSVREMKEDNPALGHRGARLLLSRQKMLETQTRALLETYKTYKNLKIMVPFIADVSEFVEIKNRMKAVADSMDSDLPEIGVMIEIPSIVFDMDRLGEYADFYSVGSNDMFQYFYALDRANPAVSSLYDPSAQAFLNLLKMIYENATKTGVPIEICGEIAAERHILEELIKIGYRDFSVNPYVINDLRKFLHKSSL